MSSEEGEDGSVSSEEGEMRVCPVEDGSVSREEGEMGVCPVEDGSVSSEDMALSHAWVMCSVSC